jgi:hypothetical protein
MACVCTVKLHVTVMCAPIRVTNATNVDAERDDLDREGGGHSSAHVTGALHGPKQNPIWIMGAHWAHQRPTSLAGMAGLRPTEEEGGRALGECLGSFWAGSVKDPSESKSHGLNVDIFRF